MKNWKKLGTINREGLSGNVKNELGLQVQDVVITAVQQIIEQSLEEEWIKITYPTDEIKVDRQGGRLLRQAQAQARHAQCAWGSADQKPSRSPGV